MINRNSSFGWYLGVAVMVLSLLLPDVLLGTQQVLTSMNTDDIEWETRNDIEWKTGNDIEKESTNANNALSIMSYGVPQEKCTGITLVGTQESSGVQDKELVPMLSEGLASNEEERHRTVKSLGISEPVEISIDLGVETGGSGAGSGGSATTQNASIKVIKELKTWVSDNFNVNYESIRGTLNPGFDFGRLTIPRLEIENRKVRYGGQAEINAGVCQYMPLDAPGSKGVALLAAHNFNPVWKINELKSGDRIYYETYYGKFEYEVYKASINYEGGDYTWLKNSYFGGNSGDLELMTCWPMNSDGSDGVRYLVFAKKISGPTLVGYPETSYEKYSSFEEYFKAVI